MVFLLMSSSFFFSLFQAGPRRGQNSDLLSKLHGLHSFAPHSSKPHVDTAVPLRTGSARPAFAHDQASGPAL